jgi:hypothetical protein
MKKEIIRNWDEKKEKLCKKMKKKMEKKLITHFTDSHSDLISLNQYLLLVIKLFLWFIFV